MLVTAGDARARWYRDSATFCGYGSASFRGFRVAKPPAGAKPRKTGEESGMTSTATAPGPTAPAPGTPPPPPPEGRDRPGGRSGLLGLLDLPGQAVRAIIRSAATTPGRLTVIAVGLVLLALVAGLVATLSVQDRDDTIGGERLSRSTGRFRTPTRPRRARSCRSAPSRPSSARATSVTSPRPAPRSRRPLPTPPTSPTRRARSTSSTSRCRSTPGSSKRPARTTASATRSARPTCARRPS